MSKKSQDTFIVYRVTDYDTLDGLTSKFSYNASRIDEEKQMLNEAVNSAKNEQAALYILVNQKSKKYIGALSLCFWTIDVHTMIYISFVFTDANFRKKKYILGGNSQYVSSFMLKDVTIKILSEIDTRIPVKTIFLLPLNDILRKKYREFGYIPFGDDPEHLMLRLS